MTLLVLALLGAVEAVVWLGKMRTAVSPSLAWSAFWTALTAGTRLAFVWVGASALLADVPWWQAIGAYVVPAVVATVLAQRWATRRERA